MTPQNIQFKRTRDAAKLPTYGSFQADCFDFYLCDDEDIPAGRTHVCNTGLIAIIPENYALHIFPRSGISIKQGIILRNLTGIIDCDYRNELLIALTNTSDQIVSLSAGTRVAQGRLVESTQHTIVEYFGNVEQVGTRVGGLGSTGK